MGLNYENLLVDLLVFLLSFNDTMFVTMFVRSTQFKFKKKEEKIRAKEAFFFFLLLPLSSVNSFPFCHFLLY